MEDNARYQLLVWRTALNMRTTEDKHQMQQHYFLQNIRSNKYIALRYALKTIWHTLIKILNLNYASICDLFFQ